MPDRGFRRNGERKGAGGLTDEQIAAAARAAVSGMQAGGQTDEDAYSDIVDVPPPDARRRGGAGLFGKKRDDEYREERAPRSGALMQGIKQKLGGMFAQGASRTAQDSYAQEPYYDNARQGRGQYADEWDNPPAQQEKPSRFNGRAADDNPPPPPPRTQRQPEQAQQPAPSGLRPDDEPPRARTAGGVTEGQLEVSPERRHRFADTSSLSPRREREEKKEQPYIPSLDGRTFADGSLLRTRYRKRNRRPMRMWLKATLTITCITAAFALLVTGTFVGVMKSRVNYMADRVHNGVRLTVAEQEKLYAEQTEMTENAAEFTQPDLIYEPDKDVQLLLIVSADNRLGTERSAVCDALMLCAIDHRNNDIKVVSIMRDLFVRIPGYYSNRISKAFYYDTATGDYSMPTLMETVRMNLGVTPDAYVVIDFQAFQKIVNNMGGIRMTLTQEEAMYMSTDEKYGLFPRYTSGGEYLMSGAEALNYVRMVKVGDGEFDRAARQRRVLMQLLRNLSEMSFTELSIFTYSVLPELPTSLTEKDVWRMFGNAKDYAALAGENVAEGEVQSSEKIRLYEQIVPITGTWRQGQTTVLGETVPVVVTNLTFNSNSIQDFIYNDDKTYVSGQLAEGVQIPEIAPLPVSEPAEGEEAPQS
ncbi:MAG: hypothetical protein E7559_04075 [Ruminococcaceae bacterium]|nr:hypothetical protein [Oscillospiraceae bacterium]